MLKLKPGVRLAGLRAEMAAAIPIIASVFEHHAPGEDVVITSGGDGQHSYGSLHYSGAALDWRTRHLDDAVVADIAESCKEALGDEFDVVLESDHLHVEFQPKGPD